MADNSKISGGDRARNALITGTAGAYLGSMVLDGKVKIPLALARLLRTRKRTVNVHGARAGGVAGAVLGATNKGKRSETVDSVGSGGDWKFSRGDFLRRASADAGFLRVEIPRRNLNGTSKKAAQWLKLNKRERIPGQTRQASSYGFSAFIEDMTFKSLPKDVQGEVTRFVDAKAGTPLVHYGMTVTELIGKADAENLKSARKALGTLRASRAWEEVNGKIKAGSKYILLMNDRIVDGHHFLAKAERGAITSSLNVLDLTPARLSTGKTTEFADKPFVGYNAKRHARTGGLNDAFRKSYNREHGSNLKGPVTTAPSKLKAGSKEAGRRASFCARMGGMQGATSKGGQLTPKGAALKRWNCESGQRLTEFAEDKHAAEKTGAKIGAATLGASMTGGGLAAVVHSTPKAGKLWNTLKGRGVTRNERRVAASKLMKFVGKQVKKDAKLLGGVAALGGLSGALIGAGAVKVHKKLVSRLAPAKEKTEFAESNRTRDLRDKLGLAKDVGTLGLIGGAGYGGHRLYKQGQKAVADLTPAVRRTLARANVGLRQAGKIGKSWRKAAITTKETLGTVNDAVQPAATMNRGIAKAGRKIAVGAKKIGQIKLWADGRKLTRFEVAPKRDKLSQARDIAVLGGAAAAAGAAGYVVHQGRKVVKAVAPTVREAKAVSGNVRNATRIGADVGRIYGDLTQPLRDPKRYAAKVKGGFRRGAKAAAAAPTAGWAKKVVHIGKKLRVLEVGPAGQMKLTQFNVIGAAIGTVAGAMLGGKVRAPIYRALLRRNPEKPLGKWAKRRARAGAYAIENGAPAIGGAVGGMIGRKAKPETQFGGSEQQADLHGGRYVDAWDTFTGKAKGYRKRDVNDYNRMRKMLKDHSTGSRKFEPDTVKRIQEGMKSIEDNPLEATTGQVGRSIMRKANTVRMVAERGGGLARDVVKHVKGEKREKDAWGREKKREWEKPWFQRKRNQLIAGGAILATGLAYRKFPKIQRGVESLKAKGKDAVNKVMPDAFPDKGTAAHAAAQTGKKQSTAAEIAADIKAQAESLKQRAAAAKAAATKPLEVVKPRVRKPKAQPGAGTGTLGLSAWPQRVTSFNDPLDHGWDLRDARGRSARVFAPGSQGRERRPKEWYEKIDNERKLWAGAALAGSGLTAAVMKKLGGKKLASVTNSAVQAERAKVRTALQKVNKMRAAKAAVKPKASNGGGPTIQLHPRTAA